MKRCLACATHFETESWDCPSCHYGPKERDRLLGFAADNGVAEAGFKPEYFARLASFEGDNFWFRGRNRLIQWALQSYFPQITSFFEIGCGTGFVLKGLRETHPELRLAGSEIFWDGLYFARARLPEAELWQMDARQLPFADEFDVLGAFDVLEHIIEDEAVLAEMFRATRPGGGIVVTVPQHKFLWSASDEYALHQRRYARGDLRAKVERAGFTVVRMTSFVSLLLPLMMLSRTKLVRGRDFDPWQEFRISRPLNALFALVLSMECTLIRSGLSFPAGGSLLLIARKPPSLL